MEWVEAGIVRRYPGTQREWSCKMLLINALHYLSPQRVLDRPPLADPAIRRARRSLLWEKWTASSDLAVELRQFPKGSGPFTDFNLDFEVFQLR